jgi:hypothetical protein
MPAGVALCQRLQQGLGLLEVSRVKALGEPAVERVQELPGAVTLALALPSPARCMGRVAPPQSAQPVWHSPGHPPYADTDHPRG